MFDLIVIGALVLIGSLWFTAAFLSFEPDMDQVAWMSWGMIAAAVVFTLMMVARVVRRPFWRRAGIVVGVALGVIAGVWLRAATLTVNRSDDAAEWHVGIIGAFALLLFVTLCLGWRGTIRRGGWTGGVRAGLALCAGAYLGYLAWDETPASSVAENRARMEAGRRGKAGYELTIRYSPAPGGGAVFNEPSHQLKFNQRDKDRIAYLKENRARIEANWAELAEVRAWWDEMAAQPWLGDEEWISPETPIIRFRVVRTYVDHALAMALLRAADGDGDGAFDDVLHVLTVGVRLQAGTETLVRGMVGQVIQRQSMEALELVLEQSTVSPAVRSGAADAIEASKRKPGDLARLMVCEVGVWSQERAGLLRAAGAPTDSIRGAIQRWLSIFVLNPQATANRVNSHYAELAELVEKRELQAAKESGERFHQEMSRVVRPKNFAGRKLMGMGVAQTTKIAESFWKNEDLRESLIARLREKAS